MKHPNRTSNFSINSDATVTGAIKETHMLRRFRLLMIAMLTFTLFPLLSGSALANEPDPTPDAADRAHLNEYQQRARENYTSNHSRSAIDAADQAYLVEYEERAREKYASMRSHTAIDAADQAYLVEYQQQAREKYSAMQRGLVRSEPVLDWSGEYFLAEYEAKMRANYAAWLATQKSPVAVDVTGE